MSKRVITEDFQEALLKYEDCPEKLFKIAKTDFEKLVAIEFFGIRKQCELIESKIKLLETLIFAVFSIGAIGVVIQIIPKLFGG